VVQAIAATKQLSNLVEAQATATQPAQTERALTAARPAIGETE
jgi:hypothetical protein